MTRVPGHCLVSVILFALVLWGNAARADELWSSEWGTVSYEKSIGRWAVWTFGPDQHRVEGRFYINGLAGVTRNRGRYEGYWVRYSGRPRCGREYRAIDGTRANYYGRLIITFLDPAFPSRWRALLGRCNEAPSLRISGNPMVGGGTAGTPQPLPLVPDILGMTEAAAESR